MPTNRVAATGTGVALALATEVLIATVTPAAPNNQVSAPSPGVLVSARVAVKGAVSATTCALQIRRGAGLTGAIILGPITVNVDATAVDRVFPLETIETVANFNGTSGVYTVSGTAAGAAQTADYAVIEVQPLSAGV